jgi:hypothetical protein
MTNQTVNDNQDGIEAKHFVMDIRKCEFKDATRQLVKRLYINRDSCKSVSQPMPGLPVALEAERKSRRTSPDCQFSEGLEIDEVELGFPSIFSHICVDRSYRFSAHLSSIHGISYPFSD